MGGGGSVLYKYVTSISQSSYLTVFFCVGVRGEVGGEVCPSQKRWDAV